jgi:hypothetical protein
MRLRFEFWHDGEQQYFWDASEVGLLKRMMIAWWIVASGKVMLHTNSDDKTNVTKTVGGREYKL